MVRSYDIELVSTPFDPASAKKEIKVKNATSDSPLYKVFICLDGQDLPFVKRVRYVLHPTFPNPRKVVHRSIGNPHCKLVIWTWGIFDVQAEVVTTDNKKLLLEHTLDYNKHFQEPGVIFKNV